MSTCVCCGRSLNPAWSPRVDSGPIHLDCWDEHHSDPTGVWPPDHVCGPIVTQPTDQEPDRDATGEDQ